MAVLTCSFLSTLLCLCPCEPLSVFSSCVYGSFFLSHFQDSVLLGVPNWLLLFPQPFPANSTLFPWWPLSNLRSLAMFPNLYALSPCHHSPFVLKSTLTSVCPALASVFPISMNSANQSAKPEFWVFWFLLPLRVPHPFSHQILPRILLVFHVCSSLTFIAHSSPLNSHLCHFVPRLGPHACHFLVYDIYCFPDEGEISVLSKSDHVIFCIPHPKKILLWFSDGFRINIKCLNIRPVLYLSYIPPHPKLHLWELLTMFRNT